MDLTLIHSRTWSRRRAVASLEMVMVLVPLILMFVALLWIGLVSIRGEQVASQARFDAWSRRDDTAAAPLKFSNHTQGRIERRVSNPVKMSWLVDALITPRSRHVVVGGAWNDPHLKLERVPNWSLAATTLQEGGGDARDSLGRLQSGLGSLWSGYSWKYNSAYGGTVQDIQGKVDELLGGLRARESVLEDNIDDEKSQLNEQIAKQRKKTQQKLDKVNERLVALDAEMKTQETTVQTERKTLKELEDDKDADPEDVKAQRMIVQRQELILNDMELEKQDLTSAKGSLEKAVDSYKEGENRLGQKKL